MFNNYRVIRSLDLMLSVVGLLLLFPLFAILLLLCTLDTGKPIFIQRRIGRFKRAFFIVKFRTMKLGTKSLPTHEVDNSSITFLGKFLRKSKLDELPQLWNVFKGDMSFVGPRPCLETQLDLISERDKRGVFDVRPGITGKAQVCDIDMSQPQQLSKVDEEMIVSLNIRNYFKLIYLTVFTRIRFVDEVKKN